LALWDIGGIGGVVQVSGGQKVAGVTLFSAKKLGGYRWKKYHIASYSIFGHFWVPESVEIFKLLKQAVLVNNRSLSLLNKQTNKPFRLHFELILYVHFANFLYFSPILVEFSS
jgi:hypothetical protein